MFRAETKGKHWVPGMIYALLLVCAAIVVPHTREEAIELPDGLYTVPSVRLLEQMRRSHSDIHDILVESPLDIQGARLVSTSNSNNNFSLTIRVPYDPAIRHKPPHFLLLDGSIFPQTGSGSGVTRQGPTIMRDKTGRKIETRGTESVRKRSQLIFTIRSYEAAMAASECLSVEPLLRKHPGHRLQATFTPSKEVIASGESFSVNLKITNIGTNIVYFDVLDMERGYGQDLCFSFQCSRNGTILEESMDYGYVGKGKIIRLPPSKTFRRSVDLTERFDMTKPGHYSITAKFFLDLLNSQHPSLCTWRDKVSGSFDVIVKDGRK